MAFDSDAIRAAYPQHAALPGEGGSPRDEPHPLPRMKLPIGIQAFAKIREEAVRDGVDRTSLILRLLEEGKQDVGFRVKTPAA